jgi:two-component system, LuxR family, sensor kinase FixL
VASRWSLQRDDQGRPAATLETNNERGRVRAGGPPQRRRLVVRSTMVERDDGPWALVAVEDAGVGFGEDDAARLFEAFYTTKPDGLGMGRSISRSIIDGHRGRLWATANPDHGATFHFALPGIR